ncbi:MarR family transcriptional regulator [Rhodocaloribacter litoris]|uniref:MarR family winged helix-turn-helix transcriptional regulator n=1 Tax=Rhodocaloribacter litoris TaxID=2558931 RepID=UPI001420CE70|nr:MarR family transcriptional regulator [Rhodocaloribacter litoris]QXD14126.1 MarR family transcriptional regulator [Rhodocaloribacter litoris]
MSTTDHVESFIRAFRHLGALYTRLAARQSAVRGEATKQELLALGVLGQSGPLRMSDLAERLGIGQSAVTPVVDRLEARGLARRTRSRADRRVWLVELTSEGEQVFAEEDAVYREVVAAMLAPLDPSERATLAALMEKITAAGMAEVPGE